MNYLYDKAVLDSRLTRGALLLLYQLIKIGHPWTKNQQELADSIGMERSVMYEALARLEDCGYIKRITTGKQGFIKYRKIVLKGGQNVN